MFEAEALSAGSDSDAPWSRADTERPMSDAKHAITSADGFAVRRVADSVTAVRAAQPACMGRVAAPLNQAHWLHLCVVLEAQPTCLGTSSAAIH